MSKEEGHHVGNMASRNEAATESKREMMGKPHENAKTMLLRDKCLSFPALPAERVALVHWVREHSGEHCEFTCSGILSGKGSSGALLLLCTAAGVAATSDAARESWMSMLLTWLLPSSTSILFVYRFRLACDRGLDLAMRLVITGLINVLLATFPLVMPAMRHSTTSVQLYVRMVLMLLAAITIQSRSSTSAPGKNEASISPAVRRYEIGHGPICQLSASSMCVMPHTPTEQHNMQTERDV